MENKKYLKLINFLHQAERAISITLEFSREQENIQQEQEDLVYLIGMSNNTYEIKEVYNKDNNTIDSFIVKIYVNNLIHKVIFTWE